AAAASQYYLSQRRTTVAATAPAKPQAPAPRPASTPPSTAAAPEPVPAAPPIKERAGVQAAATEPAAEKARQPAVQKSVPPASTLAASKPKGSSAASGSPNVPAATNDTLAADPVGEAIRVARAKADAELYDQAVADLRASAAANPSSKRAPEAYLLMGNILERQRRPDDAMASYVELRTSFGASPQAAEATFRLADLTLRSKRTDRERAAIALFTEVVALQPASALAPRALQRRAEIEDRLKLRYT